MPMDAMASTRAQNELRSLDPGISEDAGLAQGAFNHTKIILSDRKAFYDFIPHQLAEIGEYDTEVEAVESPSMPSFLSPPAKETRGFYLAEN